MQAIKFLSLVFLSTVLLTSCFWDKDKTITETKSPEQMITQTPQATEQVATEQQRVAKLEKLTSDNLSTQVEEKDGKIVLKDRRLFVNYFKSENVNTSAKLITALEKVEKFAKSQGVELNESDILVMIAGSQIENPSWNICGNFSATKKDLDTKNKYYGYIDKLCNPPAPPQPNK